MEPEKLSDFTDAKFWDNFFKKRGKKPFEWYGYFTDLLPLLEQHCGMVASSSAQLRILVPGCGNSELSAKMYDAGFKNIVNIDFSKVVIAEMLRQHLRNRPEMKWRVMDMTKMQFPNAAFDIVIDKGGLDAILGEPGEETKSAVQFLSEVERVLDRGGCYACVTLAQFHVVELLLSNYRHGWRVSIHQVAQLSEAPASELRPFLVVAKRDASTSLSLVAMSFDPLNVVEDHRKQVHFLQRVVQKENSLRKSMMDGHDTSQCLSHTGELEVIAPGRRISKTLGGNGLSRSSYSAVILDALESHGPFKYNCAVFLVPKGRTHEWLFSSEEGQWQVVESAKARRLIMVFLDANFYCGSMEDIQEDLSPVIMRLQPSNCNGGGSIPYLMSSDGVVRRVILEEVESFLTGAMLVENVALSNDNQNQTGSNYEYFRRLVFRRNPNLIQSEAQLVRLSGKLHGKARIGGKGSKLSKKKVRNEKDSLADLEFQVYHSFLASPYHAGMIAGLSLIASNLKKWVSCQELVRLVVVGLGAGLLPMFLHKHLPFGMIEVMELDPVVGDLAKRHFGFIEDERMKLNIADGLAVVNRKTVNGRTSGQNGHPGGSSETDDQRGPEKTGKTKENTPDGDALHVLIIDADSEDPSTGISCPPAEFLEETFLAAARDRLHENGMLVINVVARAKAPHVDVPQKLKKVFAEVYGMEVDEDVNRVLFALPHSSGIESAEDMLRAADRLEELATSFAPWGKGPNLRDYVTKLRLY